MSTSTNINGNNYHNSGCEYRDEEVNSKLNKTEKVARRTDIIEMVQTMKYKKKTIFKYIRKLIKYRFQIPQIWWTISKWRANTERKKQTEKQDNYLNLKLKYRNEYTLYSISEDNYNNKSTVQIGKELKERNLSETILRKERRGKEEITSKICNNTTIAIIKNNVKHQRGRESPENMIKNIGVIIRTEREEIVSSKYNLIASELKK